MFTAIAIAAVIGAGCAAAPVTATADLPAPFVFVEYGERVTVDVEQPQELVVRNVPSQTVCDDMGGIYFLDDCWNVDY